jgi:hypothetical protein
MPLPAHTAVDIHADQEVLEQGHLAHHEELLVVALSQVREVVLSAQFQKLGVTLATVRFAAADACHEFVQLEDPVEGDHTDWEPLVCAEQVVLYDLAFLGEVHEGYVAADDLVLEMRALFDFAGDSEFNTFVFIGKRQLVYKPLKLLKAYPHIGELGELGHNLLLLILIPLSLLNDCKLEIPPNPNPQTPTDLHLLEIVIGIMHHTLKPITHRMVLPQNQKHIIDEIPE